MNDHQFPIQTFHWREEDFKRVLYSFPPAEKGDWSLKGKEMEAKFEALGNDYSSLNEAFGLAFAQKKQIAPCVFVAKMRENEVVNGRRSRKDFTSKTKRREIAELFSVAKIGEEPDDARIIGMKASGELIVQVASDRQSQVIADNLSGKTMMTKGATCLASVGPFTPEVKDAGTAATTRYKIRLVPFDGGNGETARRIMRTALGLFDGGKDLVCTYVDSLGAFSVEGANACALADYLEGRCVLLSFEPMPTCVLDEFPVVGGDLVAVFPRDPSIIYPRLGILDNGIADIAPLKDWVIRPESRQFDDNNLERTHGTMVAGVALYGDRLEGREWVGADGGIELVDAPILPRGIVMEDDLTRYLDSALGKAHELARVWALAVSVNRPASTAGFSSFARTIDRLCRTHHVLVCKSAGNTMAFADKNVSPRISSGAESVLALTVGSAAHVKKAGDLSEIDAPSPFSCKGPGPEFIVKPEIMHYGGNVAVNDRGGIVQHGVKTFDAAGRVVSVCGTSFATPRVAATAAVLAHELGSEASALLLKTLLVHAANYGAWKRELSDAEVKSVGFGIPPSARDILHDDPYSATFVMEGELFKKNHIEILDFPMPPCLVRDGIFTGHVTVTLVTEQILDEGQGRERCQSDVDIKFGTFEKDKPAVPKSKKKRKEIVEDGEKADLLDRRTRDGTNCKSFLSNSAFRKPGKKNYAYERARIEAGKYAPVKKFDFDLSSCVSPRRYLAAGRRWFLDLIPQYRLAAEENYIKTQVEPKQRFCVAITVRDTQRKSPVNDEMSKLMQRSQLNNAPIRIASEAKLRVRPDMR